MTFLGERGDSLGERQVERDLLAGTWAWNGMNGRTEDGWIGLDWTGKR